MNSEQPYRWCQPPRVKNARKSAWLNQPFTFGREHPPQFDNSQAAPVAYTYQDGQCWDNSTFDIPPSAARAEVSLSHQTTTREYIEFLRDQNSTNDAGVTAYNLWQTLGKSAPVLMATTEIDLGACAADFNASGEVDIIGFLDFFDAFSNLAQSANVNADGVLGVLDLLDFLNALSACA